jgi:hypothetical protein
MRRVIALAGAIAVSSVTTPAGVAAQEGGDLAQVITWEVDPGDASAFVEGIEGIVAAAKKIGLSSDYGWTFWQDDLYQYKLVFPIAAMSYFDDPQQWMAQFMGTEAEADLMAAFEKLNGVDSRVLSDAVFEEVLDWSRMMDDMGEQMPGLVHIDEFWLKGGVEEEFGGLVTELYTLYDEIGVPYSTIGHRPRIGSTGQIVFVTLVDSRENYYGANSAMGLLQKAGKVDEWSALVAQFNGMITAGKHYDSDFLPNMSYMGPEMGMSEGN